MPEMEESKKGKVEGTPAPAAQNAAQQAWVIDKNLPPRERRKRFDELGMIYHAGNSAPGQRKKLDQIIVEYNKIGHNPVKDKINKMKKNLKFDGWI